MQPGGVTNTQAIADNLAGGDPNTAYPPDGGKYRVGQFLFDMSTAPPVAYVFSETPVGSGTYTWELFGGGASAAFHDLHFSANIPVQEDAATGGVANGGNAPDMYAAYPLLAESTLLDYAFVMLAAPPEIDEDNASLVILVGQPGAEAIVATIPYSGLGITSASDIAMPAFTPGDVLLVQWITEVATSDDWQFSGTVRLHN